jgi:hypothetical protein
MNHEATADQRVDYKPHRLILLVGVNESIGQTVGGACVAGNCERPLARAMLWDDTRCPF